MQLKKQRNMRMLKKISHKTLQLIMPKKGDPCLLKQNWKATELVSKEIYQHQMMLLLGLRSRDLGGSRDWHQ